MRVLLLAQAFPPHPEVGALRARNVVEALLQAGHHVTVVTERADGAPYDPGPSARDRFRLVPVDVGHRFGHRLLSLAGPFSAPSSKAGPVDPGKPQTAPGFLRRTALSLLSLPDSDQHLIRPFIRAGMLAGRNRVDLLYTSAPPFSLQVAGYLLRSRLRVPWVAEYRDPWNHAWTHRTELQNGFIRKIDARMERMALRRADGLVTVTEAARELLSGRLPLHHRNKLILIRNGIPDWTATPAPPGVSGDGPFTLLHAGSLYMNRDPLSFLDAVSLLVKKRKLGARDLSVRLIGRCREFQGRPVSTLVAERGLSEIVRIDDWLPHDQVRAEMLEADALVLFAQHQPLQVPNKLYEYLAAGRPIVAFVDREGECRRLLNEAGGAEMVFEANPVAVAGILERLYDQRHAQTDMLDRSNREARGRLATAVQMRELVSELEQRFSGRAAAGAPNGSPT